MRSLEYALTDIKRCTDRCVKYPKKGVKNPRASFPLLRPVFLKKFWVFFWISANTLFPSNSFKSFLFIFTNTNSLQQVHIYFVGTSWTSCSECNKPYYVSSRKVYKLMKLRVFQKIILPVLGE